MFTKPTSDRQRGFTLIEIVVTLLVSAIIGVGIVSYIGDSVEGFAASGNRNKLASSGRTVVDRIALELHNAVPNSVRVSPQIPTGPYGNQCLEFMPFVGASSYLDAPFTGAGANEFTAIRFNPELSYESEAGVYAVIYPRTNTTDLYYDSDNPAPTEGPIALIDSISPPVDDVVTVHLDASHRFTRRSPVDRFYVAQTPVSFCIVNNQLFRYQNYDIQEDLCHPLTSGCHLPTSAPDRALISNNVSNGGRTAFALVAASLRRNSIIAMDLNFSSEGDTVNLNHEVLMRNVP